MFSIAVICRPHFGQRERGRTTDNPSGHRDMHTLRNDPKHAPMKKL
jgi:hypothetical protein